MAAKTSPELVFADRFVDAVIVRPLLSDLRRLRRACAAAPVSLPPAATPVAPATAA